MILESRNISTRAGEFNDASMKFKNQAMTHPHKHVPFWPKIAKIESTKKI